MTCVVPSSRWSAATQAAALTIRRPRWRVATVVIAVAVAFFGGYLADEASGRPAVVGLVAVATFGATSGVLYVAVLFHVLRHDPGHEQHWTPQVFQFEPGYAGAEFDLWSNCNHELVSARPDVVEPSGRRVEGQTIELPQHSVARGGYISGGSYPAHYPDASAVDFGPAYTVVWTARRTHGSLQHFSRGASHTAGWRTHISERLEIAELPNDGRVQPGSEVVVMVGRTGVKWQVDVRGGDA